MKKLSAVLMAGAMMMSLAFRRKFCPRFLRSRFFRSRFL